MMDAPSTVFEDELGREVLAALQDLNAVLDVASAKENDWSRAVRDRVCRTSIPAPVVESALDRAYPGARRRFDVRLQFANGADVFIETKGAWKSYWLDRAQPGVFEDYLLSPLGGVKPTRDSAADALRKLATLTPTTASHVALLVVGSARVSDGIGADLDRFEALSLVGAHPWRCFAERLPNPHWPGYELDLRFWLAPREAVDSWWPEIAPQF